MDEPDFAGWNEADWEGVFSRYHTDDVFVDVHGQASTRGIREHIEAMKAFVESTGGAPVQVKSHPIRFGSGDWTCVVGELEDGSRMVTLAKWRDGAIAEEYIRIWWSSPRPLRTTPLAAPACERTRSLWARGALGRHRTDGKGRSIQISSVIAESGVRRHHNTEG